MPQKEKTLIPAADKGAGRFHGQSNIGISLELPKVDEGLGRGIKRSRKSTKLKKPYIQRHMCLRGWAMMDNLVNSK